MDSGFTYRDLQQLSDAQRHLVNWLRHQGECSLLDIAVHLCQDEDTAAKMLSPLIERGLIQKRGEGEEASYKIKYAPKRGQPVLKQFLEKKKEQGNG